jgi:hypothetical protein
LLCKVDCADCTCKYRTVCCVKLTVLTVPVNIVQFVV